MTTLLPSSEQRPKPRLNQAFKQLMSVHWWMAGLYLILFPLGTFMAQLEREVSFRGTLYDLHKSLGIVTLILLTWRVTVLLRVWGKKYTRRLPTLTPHWLLTTAFHAALYGCMVAVPLAGFLLSNSFKPNNVSFFGLPLPDLFPQNADRVELGRSLHFWLSYTFLAFITLHILIQRKVVRANWRRFKSFVRSRQQPST